MWQVSKRADPDQTRRRRRCGWSGSTLIAYVRRSLFAWRWSYRQIFPTSHIFCWLKATTYMYQHQPFNAKRKRVCYWHRITTVYVISYWNLFSIVKNKRYNTIWSSTQHNNICGMCICISRSMFLDNAFWSSTKHNNICGMYICIARSMYLGNTIWSSTQHNNSCGMYICIFRSMFLDIEQRIVRPEFQFSLREWKSFWQHWCHLEKCMCSARAL